MKTHVPPKIFFTILFGVQEESFDLWIYILSRDGAIMYRVLRKPRHCDGPYDVGDTVTMNM